MSAIYTKYESNEVHDLEKRFHDALNTSERDNEELKHIVYALSRKNMSTLFNLMVKLYPKLRRILDEDFVKKVKRRVYSILKAKNQRVDDELINDIHIELYNPVRFKELCYYIIDEMDKKNFDTIIHLVYKTIIKYWIKEDIKKNKIIEDLVYESDLNSATDDEEIEINKADKMSYKKFKENGDEISHSYTRNEIQSIIKDCMKKEIKRTEDTPLFEKYHLDYLDQKEIKDYILNHHCLGNKDKTNEQVIETLKKKNSKITVNIDFLKKQTKAIKDRLIDCLDKNSVKELMHHG